MLSSSASGILRLAAWTFLPDYATRTTLGFFHQACATASTMNLPLPLPKTIPQRGTPAYARQYRLTFAFVVFAYLGYTLFATYTDAPPNFYRILGVNLGNSLTAEDVDENALKFAFRTFARKNHPDRVGPGGEARFIAVRDAYEALKNPILRAAHDRFGPEVLTWAGSSTSRDYIQYGLIKSSGFYIGTTLFMFLFSIFGRGGSGEYWRYILLVGLASCELSIVFDPSPSSSLTPAAILNLFFPDRIAYQHVLFLHQVFISLCVAISRICPVVFPDPQEVAAQTEAATIAAFVPVIQRLANITQVADRESSRMLHNELRAMHGVVDPSRTFTATDQPDERVITALTSEMENMIIDKNIKEHPMLRTVWDQAVRRRRNEILLDRRPTPSRQGSSSTQIGRRVGTDSVFALRGRRDHLSPSPVLPSPPASIVALPSGASPERELEGSPPPQLQSQPLPPLPPQMDRRQSFRSRSMSLTTF